MSPRVTVILAAFLAALAFYVYTSGPDSATPGPGGPGGPGGPAAGARTPDPLLEMLKFDDQSLVRLSVFKGQQSVAVEREAGAPWKLLPTGEPADRVRLSGLTLRLSTLRASRRIPEAGDLTSFGLSNPSTRVELKLVDGTEHRLAIGEKAPAEAGIYAQKAGDAAVYVISSVTVQDLERLLTEPPREPPTPTPLPHPSPTP
jgi:hypothetical protein